MWPFSYVKTQKLPENEGVNGLVRVHAGGGTAEISRRFAIRGNPIDMRESFVGVFDGWRVFDVAFDVSFVPLVTTPKNLRIKHTYFGEGGCSSTISIAGSGTVVLCHFVVPAALINDNGMGPEALADAVLPGGFGILNTVEGCTVNMFCRETKQMLNAYYNDNILGKNVGSKAARYYQCPWVISAETIRRVRAIEHRVPHRVARV